jgi:quinolinate synthase
MKLAKSIQDAHVVANLECTYAVRMLAGEVCATEKMVTFCKESRAREIVVVTEARLLHRLRQEIRDKTFIPGLTDNCFCGECRFMNLNTLEKAYDALLNMESETLDRHFLQKWMCRKSGSSSGRLLLLPFQLCNLNGTSDVNSGLIIWLVF